MKKTLLIVMAGMLLAGCGVTNKPEEKKPEDKKGVFTTIKDAIGKQMLLKCDYADTDGQVTTTYIKGNMVRLKGTGKEVNVEGLMKENKFYLWDGEKKQGMEIDMSKMTADGTAKMGDKPIKSVEDVVSVLEENKQKCSVSTESVSMFDVPADVKFIKSDDLFGGMMQ